MGGNTKASAAAGQLIGRSDRLRVSKARLLAGVALCFAGIASSSPAAAQVTGINSDARIRPPLVALIRASRFFQLSPLSLRVLPPE